MIAHSASEVLPASLASLAASEAMVLGLQALANGLAPQLKAQLEHLASPAQLETSEALATSWALLATSGAMVLELWALAILPASLATSRFASLVSLEASGASLAPVEAQPTSLASLESSQGGNYSQEGKQSSEWA